MMNVLFQEISIKPIANGFTMSVDPNGGCGGDVEITGFVGDDLNMLGLAIAGQVLAHITTMLDEDKPHLPELEAARVVF